MAAQSYSSLTTFEKCPKKYYHIKVAKDVIDTGSDATEYGNVFHKAAEEYVRDDRPMPDKFKSMEPIVTKLKALPGEQFCELKFGIKKTDKGFEPTGFFDNDVWIRGIIDLAVVNEENGRLVDYKTGKNSRYADVRQLDLMAGAMFVYFPKLETIKSALVYVVSGDLITKEHHWEDMDEYLNVFHPQMEQLEQAEASGVWNPVPGPLCAWCPVESCDHWRPPRRK